MMTTIAASAARWLMLEIGDYDAIARQMDAAGRYDARDYYVDMRDMRRARLDDIVTRWPGWMLVIA